MGTLGWWRLVSVWIISATEPHLNLQGGKRTHYRAEIALTDSTTGHFRVTMVQGGSSTSPPCLGGGWVIRLCSKCHPGKRAPTGGCQQRSKIHLLLSFSRLFLPSAAETSLLPTAKENWNPVSYTYIFIEATANQNMLLLSVFQKIAAHWAVVFL